MPAELGKQQSYKKAAKQSVEILFCGLFANKKPGKCRLSEAEQAGKRGCSAQKRISNNF